MVRASHAKAAGSSKRSRRASHATNAGDGESASERQPFDGGKLDRRPGKHKCAQYGDLVCRRRAGIAERGGGNVSYIAIGIELTPGPAFIGRLIHGHALALERLGVERRVGGGRMAQWRQGLGHLADAALVGLRDGARPSIQSRPQWINARVQGSVRRPSLSHSAIPAVHRARALPGTRRLRAERALSSDSRHRYRNAATIWLVRRTGAGTARR